MIKYILSGHNDSYSVKRFEYFDEEDLIAKCIMTYLMKECLFFLMILNKIMRKTTGIKELYWLLFL